MTHEMVSKLRLGFKAEAEPGGRPQKYVAYFEG